MNIHNQNLKIKKSDFKVSIYVPVYNGQKTIKDCINSILSQSKKFDEIIIINDCSTDMTLDILKQFTNIKIINNKKNFGLSKSRNIGIKNCIHDVVASIDADIILDSNWLLKIISHLKEDDIVLCGGNTKEKNLNNVFNKWRSEYYGLSWGKNNKINPPFIYGSNSIQFKSLWYETKGYDENLKTAGDDINYTNRVNLLNKYKTCYVSDAICHHLQEDNLNSLANRVWRYHVSGYKIQKVSYFRSCKLIIKQFKFFFIRSLKNITKLEINYILINLYILFYFIFIEIKFLIQRKKYVS